MDADTPSSSSSVDRRRAILFGGVAAAAAAAGAGFAWWRFGQPFAGDAFAPASLWASSFQTPSGSTLEMQVLRGKPLLINFWATWCPPCVAELPLIDAFYREHAAQGWHVVGLAIDQPNAVRAFLARIPVGFPVGLAGLEGTELGRALGNGAGTLPFSVVIGANGAVLGRKMGRLSAQDLSDWARDAGAHAAQGGASKFGNLSESAKLA